MIVNARQLPKKQIELPPLPDWNTYYKVSISMSEDIGATFTGEGSYVEGDIVTIACTLDEGFDFLGWYENDELASEDLEYTFTIERNHNFVLQIQEHVEESDPTELVPYTITLYDSNPWYNAAYGKDKFLIIPNNASGNYYSNYSLTGDSGSWVHSYIKGSYNYQLVAYSSVLDIWIILAYNASYAFYSTTGLSSSWTSVSSSYTKYPSAVTWFKDRFIMVPSTGNAAYSTTGKSWSTLSSLNSTYNRVIWSDDYICLSGAYDQKRITYSLNATTWTGKDIGINGCIGFGKCKAGYFAAGSLGSGQCGISEDGINWVIKSTVPSGNYGNPISNGNVVILRETTGTKFIFTYDGDTWYEGTFPASATRYAHAYNEGKFIFPRYQSNIADVIEVPIPEES